MTTARLYCSFPCFLIICQIFTEFLSPEARKKDRGCPEPDFACGNLGRVGFPFYPGAAWAHCGLSKLDCSATPYPELDLGGGRVYEVVARESLFLRVVDRRLERLLSGQSCRTFYQNFSLPVSPAISYEVFPNLTLFRCHFNQHDNSQNENGTMNGHFNGFQRYDKCSGRTAGGFVVFYKKPYEGQNFGYVGGHGFVPPAGCSRIHLPIPLSTENMPLGEGPFGLVNATFLLEWSLSADCSECRDRGGLCIVDRTRRYRCSKGKVDSGLLLQAVLGVAALVVGILFCTILIVMIYKRRRRRKSVYANFSRSKSSEGSRKDYGVPIFTHKELEKATNLFASSRELGNGGFGTVYYGKLPDGREVAVKYLFGHSHKRKEQFVNEIEILARMRHPNLVTLYGCTSKHGPELLLVYEYVPNGTLSDHLHGKWSNGTRRLQWQTRMDIAVETARALAYLHASGIIHRDVKTSNILLTNNFSVKVADFGLSRLFPSDVTHVSTGPQGTPGYVDPEYHKCYHLTDKSDVYSFGIVLIELISSKPAVDVNRNSDEINLADLAMKRILGGEVNELVDPSFGFESDDLVRKTTSSVAALGFQCLQPNKEMRPTMAEVLQRLVEIRKEKETTTTTTTTTLSVEIITHSLESEKALNSPISVIQKWGSSKSNMAPSTSSID
ncbi:hypothetical protein DM860_008351 [Cuscuta australis]|uniref:Protein kinase domain-containing protein n=1 Tax=Cuscuta australis TaxID=267555 RepID=A0A328D7B3_9ASTE|nr:hypothetical protein DM860_008351 [Cuscuta australis]